MSIRNRLAYAWFCFKTRIQGEKHKHRNANGIAVDSTIWRNRKHDSNTRIVGGPYAHSIVRRGDHYVSVVEVHCTKEQYKSLDWKEFPMFKETGVGACHLIAYPPRTRPLS